MAATEISFEIFGEQITPERAREVIKKASQVKWGTHLVKWRFDDIVHEGEVYTKGRMLSNRKTARIFFRRKLLLKKLTVTNGIFNHDEEPDHR